MIIKEPTNIKTAPSRKYKFKLVLKIKKLKSITKNGYAISKIDAVDAPSILIPEKIKKFANVAKTTERKISPRLSFPDPSKTFIDCELRSNIGKVIIAMSTELMKSKDSGETLSNIFWSIVYTKPHVTAAAMEYINPTVCIRIKKFSSPKMRNRQFVFAPKIEYKLVAERGEANQNHLQIPYWCRGRESNPQAQKGHAILSRTCLAVPPPRRLLSRINLETE